MEIKKKNYFLLPGGREREYLSMFARVKYYLFKKLFFSPMGCFLILTSLDYYSTKADFTRIMFGMRTFLIRGCSQPS